MAKKTENYDDVISFLLSFLQGGQAGDEELDQNGDPGLEATEAYGKYRKQIEKYVDRLQQGNCDFECYVSVINVMQGVQIMDSGHSECLIVANCERAVRDFLRRIPNYVEMVCYFEPIYSGVIMEYFFCADGEASLCHVKGRRKANVADGRLASGKNMERVIGSKKDDIVSEFKKYTTLKSRIETEHVVMEGFLMVHRALSDNLQVEKVVYADAIDGEKREKLIEICERNGIAYYRASQGVMSVMTTTNPVPDVICSVRAKVRNQKELIISNHRNFFLVLDGISNPDNLGMVLRTADASGVDAVILLSNSTHHFNKNAIRGARGAVGRIPIYYCTDDFELMEVLRKRHFKIMGTSARFEASNFYDACFAFDNVAVVIGNESNGVRKEILDRCTDYVKIPMVEGQSSLNIAVAAALVLYEYDRVRYHGGNK